METATVHVEAKVGDKVHYHGSVIEAHGGGRIVKVHENGRVDIRVTELVYAFEPGRGARALEWVERLPVTVHRVRPQSWKPRVKAESGVSL